MNPYKVDKKRFKCDDVEYNVLKREYPYITNVGHNSRWLTDSEDYLKCYLEGKRVYVVGAGPSLDDNILKFIALYRGEGVVIAACSVMERLRELQFKPDYFITSEHDYEPCEGATHTSEVLISDKSLDFFDDVPLIASIGANYKYVDRYPCNLKYMIVDGCAIWDSWHKFGDRFLPKKTPWIHNPGMNVGFLAIGVAAYFNAKDCVLLGMDMRTYGDKHHLDGYLDADSPIEIQEQGFKKAMEFFVSVNGGKFGIKTINCTGDGALTPNVCDCVLGRIEEYV